MDDRTNSAEILSAIATMNFHQNDLSIKDYLDSIDVISPEEHSLYHRLLEYQNYHNMLLHENKDILAQFSHDATDGTSTTSESLVSSGTSSSSADRQFAAITDSIKIEHACFWTWLMPIEMTYLSFRKTGFVHEVTECYNPHQSDF